MIFTFILKVELFGVPVVEELDLTSFVEGRLRRDWTGVLSALSFGWSKSKSPFSLDLIARFSAKRKRSASLLLADNEFNEPGLDLKQKNDLF